MLAVLSCILMYTYDLSSSSGTSSENIKGHCVIFKYTFSLNTEQTLSKVYRLCVLNTNGCNYIHLPENWVSTYRVLTYTIE